MSATVSASEQTSRTLQAKDLNIHEAMDAIAILHSYISDAGK